MLNIHVHWQDPSPARLLTSLVGPKNHCAQAVERLGKLSADRLVRLLAATRSLCPLGAVAVGMLRLFRN